MIYPNGGEVIHQNQQVTLQWTASDNVGVNGVDVQLVNGASVTTLASNYPNTGSYDHVRMWDASTAAAGVYFVRFEAPGFHADQRLVVIR